VDVWIVFRVYVFEFWMECFISGAGALVPSSVSP